MLMRKIGQSVFSMVASLSISATAVKFTIREYFVAETAYLSEGVGFYPVLHMERTRNIVTIEVLNAEKTRSISFRSL